MNGCRKKYLQQTAVVFKGNCVILGQEIVEMHFIVIHTKSPPLYSGPGRSSKSAHIPAHCAMPCTSSVTLTFHLHLLHYWPCPAPKTKGYVIQPTTAATGMNGDEVKLQRSDSYTSLALIFQDQVLKTLRIFLSSSTGILTLQNVTSCSMSISMYKCVYMYIYL